jgi:hypothetical protein
MLGSAWLVKEGVETEPAARLGGRLVMLLRFDLR